MKCFSAIILCLAVLASFSSTTVGQTTVQIGAGALVNTTTTYPAPLGNWYWGSRQQFLYTAGDFASACVATGGPITITKIGFNVSTVSGAALTGYTIAMANTATTTLSAWEAGLSAAFGPALVTPVAGWNTITLTTPFVWDGISNVVVDCCFNNAAYTSNCISPQTATPAYISTRLFRQDAVGNCGNAGLTSTHLQRPNTQFEVSSVVSPLYQVNQGNVASLTVNGLTSSSCAPVVSTAASGSIVLTSNLIGYGWELVYNFAPQAPAVLTLPEPQFININFPSYGIYFVNNFFGGQQWPAPGIPGITTTSLLLTYAGLPSLTTVSMQAVWFNPANISGYSVSAAATIAVP